MYTINDTVFALILRFVGCRQELTFSDQEFIQKQFQTIKKHIEEFPPEERDLRAMEWIERYAREYRSMWEKETINKEFVNQRCPDCPLRVDQSLGHCQIHNEWLQILQRYINRELTSKEYVESALGLISQQKENLKVKLSSMKNINQQEN